MKERIKNFLNKHRNYFLLVAVLGIWIDIFLLKSISDITTLVLVVLWILVTWLYHVRGKFLAIPATIFLVLSPLFSNKGEEAIADRMAVWIFIFLTLGVLRELFCQRK